VEKKKSLGPRLPLSYLLSACLPLCLFLVHSFFHLVVYSVVESASALSHHLPSNNCSCLTSIFTHRTDFGGVSVRSMLRNLIRLRAEVVPSVGVRSGHSVSVVLKNDVDGVGSKGEERTVMAGFMRYENTKRLWHYRLESL